MNVLLKPTETLQYRPTETVRNADSTYDTLHTGRLEPKQLNGALRWSIDPAKPDHDHTQGTSDGRHPRGSRVMAEGGAIITGEVAV